MEAIDLFKFMEETKSAVKDSWGCRPYTKNTLIPFHTDLMGGYQKSPAEALAPPVNS